MDSRHDATLMLFIVAIVLVTLFLIPPDGFSGITGQAVHPLYSTFSAPEQGFSVTGNQATVVDDLVYRTGYYSVNGSAWHLFSLSGTTYPGNSSWRSGGGSYSLPAALAGRGEHYVIVYGCSLTDGAWDCHGDRWQLETIINGEPPATVSWSGELLVNGGFETSDLTGWIPVAGVTDGFDVISRMEWNGEYNNPQAGSYMAYSVGGGDGATLDFYLYQDVDLSAYMDAIDTGEATINASGWGSSSEYDNGVDLTRIQFQFLDAAKGVIATAHDSGDVYNHVWWQAKIADHAVPAGTRYVRVWGRTYERCTHVVPNIFCDSGSLDTFSVKIGYGSSGPSSDSSGEDTKAPTITFESPTPDTGATVSSSSQTIVASISDASAVSSWADVDNSLLLWLRLDGNSADSSPSTRPSSDSGVSYVAGRFGRAASGFSESNKITVDPALDFASSDMTVSFWVNVHDYTSPARQNPFGKAFGGDGSLTLEESGVMNFYFGDTGADEWPYTSPSSAVSVTPNTWEHWAIVRDVDSTTVYMYRNGVSVLSPFDYSIGNENDAAISTVVHSDNPLTIGDNYMHPLNGAIDEFMIFGRALSASEVRSLYDAKANKLSVPLSGLSNGQHAYKVYAVDAEGNLMASGTRTFTVQAETTCTSHASSACSSASGDVYWYDSCGVREEVRYDCTSAQTCSGGACIAIPPSSGNTYYLSPSGSDTSGDGSMAKPWFSLNKAWTVIGAGDTIYMRGGTYRYDYRQLLSGKSGTADDMIRVWAYEDETPIISPSSSFTDTRGIAISRVDYLHLKGLEIAGFEQREGTNWYNGIVATNVNHCIFEQLDVHHNGFGFSIGETSNDNLVLNSDFHHNSDPLTAIGTNIPWGGSDGLTIRVKDATATNTISGCRMWWNSDDGIDLWENEGMIILNNSWAFWNGFQPGNFLDAGDGNGFKLGPTFTTGHALKRRITNNIAFQNKLWGFVDNAATCNMEVYNNIAFQNCYKSDVTGVTWCGGFYFYYQGIPIYLKNNIAYGNILNGVNRDKTLNVLTNVNHNSWDSPVTVTDADFASLDGSQLLRDRKSDGSLPDIGFLHLASGSDLIDKGVNVGLPYSGDYPDLGAFETTGSQQPSCTSHASSACSSASGDVYWYDSCGVREEVRYDCTSAQTCANGACIAIPSSSGPIIIDHTTADVSKIPACWIDAAQENLRIAYSHASHGDQLVSGMEALQSYDSSKYGLMVGWDWSESSWNTNKLYMREYQGWEDTYNMFPGISSLSYSYARASDVSHTLNDWSSLTRTYLDGNSGGGRGSTINVMMWSWCGLGDGNGDPITPTRVQNEYLAKMRELMDEYDGSPKREVKFVLMTIHNDAGFYASSQNAAIRSWCSQNDDCILYDFADLEQYDPFGTDYTSRDVSASLRYTCNSVSKGCNWASDYLNSGSASSLNTQLTTILKNRLSGDLAACQHSPELNSNYNGVGTGESSDSVLNCALKGQAAWYLWARLAGWNGLPEGAGANACS